jgi:diguanylate cyclase (GGDEF)-like protein/PAS domain S-box-containing protein
MSGNGVPEGYAHCRLSEDSSSDLPLSLAYTALFRAPVGIFIVGRDGRILDCNDSFLGMAGAPREKVVGFNLLSSSEDCSLLPHLHECLAGKPVSFESAYTSTTGHKTSVYRYSFHPPGPADHGNAGAVCFAEDIGPQKQLEEAVRALRLSEERFSKAFRASPDPMILSAIDTGQVLDINVGFTEQYGYTREETIGRTTLDIGLWADLQQRADTAALMRERGELRNHEVDFRTKDGRIVTVLGSAAKLSIDGHDHWLVQFRDITERKRLLLALENQARTDYLTGLANRRYFMERAEQEVSRLKRHGGDIAVLMLDLDHFKRINDDYGHRTGDETLRAFSQCCRLAVRDIDILARMGGEEFAILLPQTSDAQAVEVAERIRRTTADIALRAEDGRDVSITVSIGIATTSGENDNDNLIEMLLNNADKALYCAKEGGRNRVICGCN